MDHNTDQLEDNVARLIRSGFDRGARPDPGVRERTWQLLAARLPDNRVGVEFSERFLGLLVGILVLMAAWRAMHSLGIGPMGMVTAPFVAVISALLALNLVAIPIASLVIVLRRRHV